MKILKPGKVEQRKFVCNKCGCVFVARKTEMLWTIYGLRKCCPTCYESHEWDNGEPYEEPTQCDFCASLIGGKKELMYEGRKTKYCPFCGRKFGEVSNDE